MAHFLVAFGVSTTAAGLLLSCQLRPPGTLHVAQSQAQQQGQVNFSISVPRKVSKPVRSVLATGTESSTLLVNRVDVSLNGPGFFSPLYPPGTELQEGEIVIQGGSVSSHIANVPTGRNRFLKVVARNGQQKLNQVGGVLDVQPGPYNHVVVGLATTPTAHVVEKLSLAAPEVAIGFDAKALQRFLDGHVTKPVIDDPAQQNVFQGFHPYRVHADGLVSYLMQNNYQLPTSFDPATSPGDTFVLQKGTVRIITDGLSPGSRLWLNDPTSPILQVTDATTTEYVIDDIAPNFEQSQDEALPPAWSLTVLTTDGRLTTMAVAIPRVTLADPALGEVRMDLRSKLSEPGSMIQRIFLSPDTDAWNAGHVTLNGRKAQQLFVYAEDNQGNVSPLLPNALDWESLDPRVQVGNGVALTSGDLAGLGQTGQSLAGQGLEDYGLVYPLAETSATDASDVATVRGTLKGTALSATLPFRIGYLGDETGRVQIDVQVPALQILQGDLTLLDPTVTVPLTAAEPLAPEGATYRWVSDHPLITLGEGLGRSIALGAMSQLPTGTFATVTVYSSTGRQASVKVETAFGAGAIQGAVTAPTAQFSFDALPTLNAGNEAITADARYGFGAYLNLYGGQATIGARDPGWPDGGTFYWRSSDPFTIGVSGAFPGATAKVTALRPGTVTITATDARGVTYSSQLSAVFNRTGRAEGVVEAPVNAIALAGTTEAEIARALNAVLATGLYQATESGVAAPEFRWLSLDPYRLEIAPPAGETFPNDRAVFKALRPGQVSFKLLSAKTGQTKVFTINLAFADGTSSGSLAVPSLLVKQVTPTPPTGSTAMRVINRNPGETVTLEASDPSDAQATFAWMSETPGQVQVLSQGGQQAQIKIIHYGTGNIRVVNTRNGRWGRMTFDVQNTGKGTGTIEVTL